MTNAHRDYQRSFYDQHFAKREAAVRQQLAHPLFRSFNDRVAQHVLEVGLRQPATRDDGSPVRVFEPGCGEGLVASALERTASANGVDLAYVGSDLSGAALELASAAVDGTFLVGDATEVAATLASQSQDIVIAKNLLHHLDDPVAFLRQAARVLVPGGRVVAFEPRLGCPQFLLFNLLAPRRERHYFKGQGRNRAAFTDAGLRVLGCQRFSWLPYELAFVIRPDWFRRLCSTEDARTIERVSQIDERLAARLGWFSCYSVWVAAADDDETASGAPGRDDKDM